MVFKEDVAWAAGMVDGEGCIDVRLHRKKGDKQYQYILRLVVTNTSKPALLALQNIFGCGKIYKQMRRTGTKPAIAIYQWEVLRENAKGVIQLVYPHLRVKPEEARFGLDFHELLMVTRWKETPISEDTLAQRDAYYWKLRSLKPRNRDIVIPL